MLTQEQFDRMDWATFLFEARRAGEAKGLDKFAELILKLQSLGRSGDVQKALSDANHRSNLLQEFGML